jgi:hypothetical protein
MCILLHSSCSSKQWACRSCIALVLQALLLLLLVGLLLCSVVMYQLLMPSVQGCCAKLLSALPYLASVCAVQGCCKCCPIQKSCLLSALPQLQVSAAARTSNTSSWVALCRMPLNLNCSSGSAWPYMEGTISCYTYD